MAADPLDAFGTVTLSASGGGVVTLQPAAFRTWTVTAINVYTDQGPAETPFPQCIVYLGERGGQRITQTYMGNQATAGGSPVIVQPSQKLVVEWLNGKPGSRATVWLYGTMDMR